MTTVGIPRHDFSEEEVWAKKTAASAGTTEVPETADGSTATPSESESRVEPGTDALRLFLREAGCYPLLTAKREKELSAEAQPYIALREAVRDELEEAGLGGRKRRKRLYNEVPEEDLGEVEGFGERLEQKLKVLSESEKAEIEKSKAAFELFVNSNLRLVVSIARNYLNNGLPFLDLIQEGTLGLIRGVEKFDRSRGLKFSTYGTQWIKQACSRALADKSRIIRKPVHVVERSNKINKAIRRLSASSGRELDIKNKEDIAAIAEAIDEPVGKVIEALSAAAVVVSLNKPVGEDSDSEFGDFVEPNDAPLEDEVADELEKSLLGQAVRDLPLELRQVIEIRYGLNGESESSLQEVGRRLGFGRERARQLETEGLKQLAANPLLADTGIFYAETKSGAQAKGRSDGVGQSHGSKVQTEEFRGADSEEVIKKKQERQAQEQDTADFYGELMQAAD